MLIQLWGPLSKSNFGHCKVLSYYLNVNSHRYLGVIIEDGKCELDIKRQLMKFYANANTL